jgi:hypothetical protein
MILPPAPHTFVSSPSLNVGQPIEHSTGYGYITISVLLADSLLFPQFASFDIVSDCVGEAPTWKKTGGAFQPVARKNLTIRHSPGTEPEWP